MPAALAAAQKDPLPLPGFEHIRRAWNRKFNRFSARVLPGEYVVTAQDELLITVLGSCIAACIRDPLFGIGGMNHFMLPDTTADDTARWHDTDVNPAMRYGSFAMEHLINDIIKFGGRREALEIKLFGGGQVLQSMTSIGQGNITFVKNYLENEGFKITSQDLGHVYPRKVIYFPASGRALVKKLRGGEQSDIIQREKRYLHDLEHQPVAGEITLF